MPSMWGRPWWTLTCIKATVVVMVTSTHTAHRTSIKSPSSSPRPPNFGPKLQRPLSFKPKHRLYQPKENNINISWSTQHPDHLRTKRNTPLYVLGTTCLNPALSLPRSWHHVNRKSFVVCSAPVRTSTTSALTPTCYTIGRGLMRNQKEKKGRFGIINGNLWRRTNHDNRILICIPTQLRMQNLTSQSQNRPDGYGTREGNPVEWEEADVSARKEGGVGEAELYKGGWSDRGGEEEDRDEEKRKMDFWGLNWSILFNASVRRLTFNSPSTSQRSKIRGRSIDRKDKENK